MANNPKGDERVEFARRLGRTIALIRTVFGMTQREVAKLAGVSQSGTISRWEQGLTEMTAYDLVQVAKALGVKPQTLLTPEYDLSKRLREGLISGASPPFSAAPERPGS